MDHCRIGLDSPTGLKPIQSRHHHVEQDDVGLLGLDLRQRLKSVGGRAHGVAFGREPIGQES
jgi:hypothetical protein